MEKRDPAAIERSCNVEGSAISMGDDYVATGTTFLLVPTVGPHYDLTALEEWVAWRDSRKS